MSEEGTSASFQRDGVWYDAAGKVYRNQERASDPEYRGFVDRMINAAADEERHLAEPNVAPEDYPTYFSTIHMRGPRE